ncbi:MAG: hypothetical protein CVV17_05410 [Gammaproteobacteria bacterium HGW-Gammaproteobacteria-7]|jgi:hypothetical protein|nr:MAG: hypothetical protein CVV17_05410 [Gammaproteobacteria bacterium HGW-Gammaproteobacteria-7]
MREAAREALVGGESIRDAVRDLMVRALGHQPLTQDNIRAVATSVLEGAIAGAPQGSTEAARALREAAEGIDEAIARAAQASHLAIAEAVGRADEFSENDLRQALRDLRELENLFQDVVISVAKGGSSVSRSIVEDLARHFERAGTDTARAVRQAMETGQGAGAHHLPYLGDMARTTRSGLSTIAAIGSGILSGLSEGLAPRRDAPAEPKDP